MTNTTTRRGLFAALAAVPAAAFAVPILAAAEAKPETCYTFTWEAPAMPAGQYMLNATGIDTNGNPIGKVSTESFQTAAEAQAGEGPDLLSPGQFDLTITGMQDGKPITSATAAFTVQ